MTTVLVTGGSGFIGVYTARALAERGDKVVAFDPVPASPQMRKIVEPYKSQITYARGDITDLPDLLSAIQHHRVEKIVHTAAMADPSYSADHPYVTHKVNVLGTINVLEAARLLGLQRVVFISSYGAFAPKRYEPMDEYHPVLDPTEGCPQSHYGASKAAGEIIGMNYYAYNSVDFLAIRFTRVYGFGMRSPRHIRPLVEGTLKGETVRVSAGAVLGSDYTYVKDNARAVMAALDADASRLKQRIFIIGQGQPYRISEVAKVLQELIPGARFELEPTVSEWEAQDAKGRGALDLSRTREQLGWQAIYDLRKGLEDYIAMYRQYGDK